MKGTPLPIPLSNLAQWIEQPLTNRRLELMLGGSIPGARVFGYIVPRFKNKLKLFFQPVEGRFHLETHQRLNLRCSFFLGYMFCYVVLPTAMKWRLFNFIWVLKKTRTKLWNTLYIRYSWWMIYRKISYIYCFSKSAPLAQEKHSDVTYCSLTSYMEVKVEKLLYALLYFDGIQ